MKTLNQAAFVRLYRELCPQYSAKALRALYRGIKRKKKDTK